MHERRREFRFATDQDAQLTLLAERDERIPVRLNDISGSGARFESPRPIAPESPVRLDLNDSLLLGEITYCFEQNGLYVCGAQLDQVLHHVSDMAQLMSRLSAEEIFSRIAK